MAGDWIKMRTDLGTDPAVIRIGLRTSLDSYAVVGRLHALWAWADAHTANGLVRGVTTDWIDAFVTCRGFADAMCEAGWLAVKPEGIEFPRFGRHMGGSAKARAQKTKRQQRWRRTDETPPKPGRGGRVVPAVDAGVDAGVDAAATTEAPPEKRREEKREDIPTGGAAAEPPPAAKPPPVPRVRREPTGPHAEAVRYFCDEWQVAHGEKYPFAGGKDGTAVKEILAHVGGDLDKFRAVVSRYFANSEVFFAGHQLAKLRGQLARFLVDAPTAVAPRRGGIESQDERVWGDIQDALRPS